MMAYGLGRNIAFSLIPYFIPRVPYLKADQIIKWTFYSFHSHRALMFGSFLKFPYIIVPLMFNNSINSTLIFFISQKSANLIKFIKQLTYVFQGNFKF